MLLFIPEIISGTRKRDVLRT